MAKGKEGEGEVEFRALSKEEREGEGVVEGVNDKESADEEEGSGTVPKMPAEVAAGTEIEEAAE